MTAADYPAVRRVDVASQREYRGPEWDSLSEDQQAASLMSEAAAAEFYGSNEFCLVAEEDATIVGFLLAYREPIPVYGRVYVDGIAVEPEHRRAGMGARLYRELLRLAAAAGVREVRALITPGNTASVALHESVGFVLRDRKEADLTL